jgi:hypothetical protein
MWSGLLACTFGECGAQPAPHPVEVPALVEGPLQVFRVADHSQEERSWSLATAEREEVGAWLARCDELSPLVDAPERPPRSTMLVEIEDDRGTFVLFLFEDDSVARHDGDFRPDADPWMRARLLTHRCPGLRQALRGIPTTQRLP